MDYLIVKKSYIQEKIRNGTFTKPFMNLMRRKKWCSNETVTKTREKTVKKYFDTIEECYKYVHPVYGEHYLKNGYLEKRYYYGTEK